MEQPSKTWRLLRWLRDKRSFLMQTLYLLLRVSKVAKFGQLDLFGIFDWNKLLDQQLRHARLLVSKVWEQKIAKSRRNEVLKWRKLVCLGIKSSNFGGSYLGTYRRYDYQIWFVVELISVLQVHKVSRFYEIWFRI